MKDEADGCMPPTPDTANACLASQVAAESGAPVAKMFVFNGRHLFSGPAASSRLRLFEIIPGHVMVFV